MERVGSGIRFMINQLRQYGLPDPEFKEIDTEFAVTFYRASNKPTIEPQTYRQAEMPIATESSSMPVPTPAEKTGFLYNQQQRREMALEYVRKNGSISHKEYRALTSASETTTIRDLENMVNNGIIRRIGDGPRRRYVI
jgi:ATP-dependent DNA helicase RecG